MTATTGASAGTRKLDASRAVLLATALSAAIHLLMAGSLPLILTPDSGEYVRGAIALRDGSGSWVELNRTPAYPMFLAATFALFGVGAGGILIVQNMLAVGSCALVTWTATRVASPRAALVFFWPELERQVLAYCHLDTWAMVRLWAAFTNASLRN